MSPAVITMYIAVLLWGLICGGFVYEHVAVVPVWTANPPESLAMGQGRHRLAAERFWRTIHPITLLTLTEHPF